MSLKRFKPLEKDDDDSDLADNENIEGTDTREVQTPIIVAQRKKLFVIYSSESESEAVIPTQLFNRNALATITNIDKEARKSLSGKNGLNTLPHTEKFETSDQY